VDGTFPPSPRVGVRGSATLGMAGATGAGITGLAVLGAGTAGAGAAAAAGVISGAGGGAIVPDVPVAAAGVAAGVAFAAPDRRASRLTMTRFGAGTTGPVGATGAAGDAWAAAGADLRFTSSRIWSRCSGSMVLSWLRTSRPCCWHRLSKSLLSMSSSRARAKMRTLSFFCCKRNSPCTVIST